MCVLKKGGKKDTREKIKEIGRDGIVDWRKRIPTLRLTARQLEYGSMEFYRKIAKGFGRKRVRPLRRFCPLGSPTNSQFAL